MGYYKSISVFLLSFVWLYGVAQNENAFISDKVAKKAVYEIVRYSGLSPSFKVVEDRSIKNAKAFIKSKERIIAYNPKFMQQVVDSSKSNWSAISILAHEVGHHLLGHTIKGSTHPGDELSADEYSGFILYQMGATHEQSISAIEVAVLKQDGNTHPPKELRKQAILQGWEQAKQLSLNNTNNLNLITAQADSFIMKLQFQGDLNSYYVNKDHEVVWHNNSGQSIVLGKVESTEENRFIWEYVYNDKKFGIDSHGNIWCITPYEACYQVGSMLELKKKEE